MVLRRSAVVWLQRVVPTGVIGLFVRRMPYDELTGSACARLAWAAVDGYFVAHPAVEWVD